MRLFDDHNFFSSGTVRWDHLIDLDMALPFSEQESLVGCENVLLVEYPNKVLLDVSFLARESPEAFMRVEVIPPQNKFVAAKTEKCETFEEVKCAILSLHEVARDWKV